MNTSSNNACSSVLSRFLSPSPKGNTWELLLERRTRELRVDVLLQDIQTFTQTSGCSITCLFAHHSFLRGLSETQQMQLLSSLPDLEEISLSSSAISAKALVRFLCSAPNLKKLYLDRVVLQCAATEEIEQRYRLCKALGNLESLFDFHLFLGGSGFTSADEGTVALFSQETDDITPLVQALCSIERLRNVYLGYELGTDRRGIDPKALALLSQKTRHMVLRNIRLDVQQVSRLRSKSLKSLALLNNSLSDDGAITLAQLLSETSLPSLRKLFVSGNHLSDKGGIAIVQAIQGNQNLHKQVEVLDFHCNIMSSNIAVAIAEFLRMPTCQLKYIDLSCNNIGDDQSGSCNLAFALRENCKLEQLVLYQCGLGNRVCQAFALSLSVNKTLKKLNLNQNQDITKGGVAALSETLKTQNFVLQRLEVKAPKVTNAHKRSKAKKQPEKQDPVGELNYFLKLNREGRQKLLLQSTTDIEYIHKGLASTNQVKDVDSLFYFLRERPTIISNALTSPTTNCVETLVTKAIAAKFERSQQQRRKAPMIPVANMLCSPQA